MKVFKQMQMETSQFRYQVLVSKKGKMTIQKRLQTAEVKEVNYSHNRAKHYILEEGKTVPCCQHELNGQMANEVLAPLFSYGLIKERMAALVTDSLRAEYLKREGYDTQILEFIDMEHTPKNLLIRAVYTGKKKENEGKLRACLDAFSLHPTLESLLFEGGIKE